LPLDRVDFDASYRVVAANLAISVVPVVVRGR
jgi:hypothetical protein